MIAEHRTAQFIEDRGALTTSYGPFVLRTAFQPIFSQDETGHLTIEAFEALIRAERDGEQVPPMHFFSLVEPAEALYVDTLCRELHIRNMGRMGRASARLFINFNPGLYTSVPEIDRAVGHMSEAAANAGLRPSRIVCEITEQISEDGEALLALVRRLRANMFQIAVDDYGSDESDIARVDLLKPDVIKFDAAWVRRFTETPAGQSLLGLLVTQFVDRGILCLFEGLEEEHQVAFCREIGVTLMQGYALARPQLAPTTFDLLFPEPEPAAVRRRRPAAPKDGEEASGHAEEAHSPRLHPFRRPTTFGRRLRSF
jgi:FOG: EAL domain